MKTKHFSGAQRHSLLTIAAALCMLILFACKEKHPAVIETPVFDVWATSALEIEKIEMSDSTTIFHIHAFFHPKEWIKISSETFIRESGTDEKLTIVDAEGIELDEKFFMPESGETSFKLYFPPLKPEVTKIDFIECESDGCFNIWGIRLTDRAKVEVTALTQKTCTQPVPALEYSTKPAKLSGKYFGYSKAMNKEVYVDYADFSDEIQTVTATVADDGSFSLEAPVGYPGVYHSSLGRIFLTPGQEVKCYVDLVKQTRNASRLRKDKEPGDSINVFTESDGFFISQADINKVANLTPQPENPEAILTEFFAKKPDEQVFFASFFSPIVYISKYLYLPEEVKNKPVQEQFAVFKEKAKSLPADANWFYDHVLASLYSARIQASKFYTDADKEEIKAAFAGNPAYAETLLAENEKMKALTEENTSLIQQVPDVTEAQVFNEILKRYQGKVVLVDFWATWCGPCKQAFKTMTPLKESWHDKNIVFVYLTGETSPLAVWNKMIPDIHGEHYRVSDSQWKYWGKSLEIRGVPTYMIYDKNGSQVQRYTGYPGNDKLKKVIEALF
ncbi:MAG: thioredoxin fold domain-containing protein [Dysgonamonadaceae bacterium]|jgi:thiol-disulfide isomerase/thioredoxin|nr:thioredoxin fold domain-containing protein [Dysgonamonadaceae bacterium]